MLITGGTGLVGLNVAAELSKEGFDIVLYDLEPRKLVLEDLKSGFRVVQGDIRDFPNLLKAVKENRVEGIVHTAGIVSEKACERAGLQVTYEVNCTGTLNVLEVARRESLRRVLYTSTAGLYGPSDPNTPIKEAYPLPTHYEVMPLYYTTKRIAETLIDLYHSNFTVEVVACRIMSVFGPGERRFEQTIWRMILSALRGEEYIDEINGRDLPKDKTYIKDLAGAFCKLYKSKCLNYTKYNVSGGKNYTLLEIANTVKKLIPTFKFSLPVSGCTGRTALKGPLDLQRIREETGWAPNYSLEDAIKESIDWFKGQESKSII